MRGFGTLCVRVSRGFKSVVQKLHEGTAESSPSRNGPLAALPGERAGKRWRPPRWELRRTGGELELSLKRARAVRHCMEALTQHSARSSDMISKRARSQWVHVPSSPLPAPTAGSG